VIGDQWATLILRDAFLGMRRFEDFQCDLGASRGVLAARLDGLVEAGMLRREQYQDRPPRHEYRLTDKGRAFWDVLAAMWRFGEDWQFEPGDEELELINRETGEPIRPQVIDETTGAPLDLHATRVRTRR